MKHILFTNAVHLRRIIDFARKNKCEAELGLALLRLLELATMGMIKPYSASKGEEIQEAEGVDILAEIGKDWAPLSMGLAIFYDASAPPQLRPNTSRLLNGGFIYSGPGLPSDGSAGSLTVSLDPDAATGAKPMWSIHT